MSAPASEPGLCLRFGVPADLDALLALEQAAFHTDHLSRRSFRHFLTSPNAHLLVAEQGMWLAGYMLLLFRPGSAVARLYSIAVAAALAGRGIGPMLLTAAEQAACRRGCATLRLEVHEQNAVAISRYRKSGYQLLGRHLRYYKDGGDALRFEKQLGLSSTGHKDSSSPVASVAR